MLERGRHTLQETYCPSAARTGSRRATFLISATACRTRWIAGCDFQPKAPRRKRLVNSQRWASALGIVTSPPMPHRALQRPPVVLMVGPLFARHDDVRSHAGRNSTSNVVDEECLGRRLRVGCSARSRVFAAPGPERRTG